MAALSSILFVCSVLDAAAVSIVASDKAAPVIRRESRDEKHINLDASGRMHSLAQELPAFIKAQHKAHEPTECNLQFLQMDEGSDECVGDHGPVSVNDPGQCMHAAQSFGDTISRMMDTAECTAAEEAGGSCNYWEQFEQNTHKLGELPLPKGCYLNTTSNKVYFNPTASNATGLTLTGKKICVRTAYINGTTDSNPQDGCLEGTTAILNYDACLAASLCADGGGACKIQEFKDNVTTYKKSDRPMGCFVDSDRCWGFNWEALVNITGSINGTPVCLEAGATPGVHATVAVGDSTTAAPAAD